MSDLRDFAHGFPPNFHYLDVAPVERAVNVAQPASDRVEHTSEVASDFGALLFSTDLSDVVFVVEDVSLPAHRTILAARCAYFKAMLFGGMRECREGRIVLQETPLRAFKELLKYIYTGHIELVPLGEENIIDLIGLAHRYSFTKLIESISNYLKTTLCLRNVCSFLQLGHHYSIQSLTQHCHSFADRNASAVVTCEGFKSLSSSTIEELIARDSFCAPEIDIFKAIHEWSKVNTENASHFSSLVSRIRLSLMSLDELLHTVRPSNLLTSDAILDAIKEQSETSSTNLLHRGFLLPDTNIATSNYASVIHGDCPSALLLPPDYTAIQDGDRVYTRHHIDDNPDGIVIQLNNPYIINKIVLWLWDRESRMYTYFVEVSMDQVDWVRVVDHTKYLCRSTQTLYFHPRAVRYIRVVGTSNSGGKQFHLVRMEALHTSDPFTLDPTTHLIVPSRNIAAECENAIVIEGVSRCRNALINGRVEGYDWDNGYTCHQLGSGSITVQLSQPYLISSLRLLLWDCDDRYYSYYIEVSFNQLNWKRVVDRTAVECRGWQALTFPAEIVVFIRIVGTFNSANEVFHCVHLECPASIEPEPQQDESGDGAEEQMNE